MISEKLNNISKEDFKRIAGKLHAGMNKNQVISVLDKEEIKLSNEQIDSLVTTLNSELSENELNNVAGGCGGGGNDSSED